MQMQIGIDHEITHVLSNLIEVCKDSEQAFRTAAHALDDFRIKNLCQEFALQRASFAQELEHEISLLGRAPGGLVSALPHRGWNRTVEALVGANRKAIVSECEREERLSKLAYEKALATGFLPMSAKQIIERQYFEVKMVYDLFRALERSAAA